MIIEIKSAGNGATFCRAKTAFIEGEGLSGAWLADKAALRVNRDGLGQIGMRFGRFCDYGNAIFQQAGNFVTVKAVTVLPNKITAIV